MGTYSFWIFFLPGPNRKLTREHFLGARTFDQSENWSEKNGEITPPAPPRPPRPTRRRGFKVPRAGAPSLRLPGSRATVKWWRGASRLVHRRARKCCVPECGRETAMLLGIFLLIFSAFWRFIRRGKRRRCGRHVQNREKLESSHIYLVYQLYPQKKFDNQYEIIILWLSYFIIVPYWKDIAHRKGWVYVREIQHLLFTSYVRDWYEYKFACNRVMLVWKTFFTVHKNIPCPNNENIFHYFEKSFFENYFFKLFFFHETNGDLSLIEEEGQKLEKKKPKLSHLLSPCALHPYFQWQITPLNLCDFKLYQTLAIILMLFIKSSLFFRKKKCHHHLLNFFVVVTSTKISPKFV